MGSDKRERQKERGQAKRDDIARLADREVWRQRLLLFLVLAALIGGAIFLFSLTGDEEDEAATSSVPDPVTTTTTESTTTVTELELVPPPLGGTIDGPTPCPAEDGSEERITTFSEAPPMCINPSAIYTAIVSTSEGDITVELDAAKAPNTVNNFVVLSRYHYYEGVPFHRIIPSFVIQGGDAVGPTLGIGGPGYQFDDELPEEGDYQVGSLAMANSGPDTNGSQFFIITGEAGVGLQPQFSLFGLTVDGFDVVEAIDALGSAGAGKPTESVTINAITISEG